MALINCAECGREISSLAASCPNCGFPVQQKEGDELTTTPVQKTGASKVEQENTQAAKILLVAIVLAVIFGVATCSGGPESTPQTDEHIGKKITAYCMHEAGIPEEEDDPTHAITPIEMEKLTACVNKQIYGR